MYPSFVPFTPRYLASGDVIPAGVIALWFGDPASIPAGWTLCDGTLGTPDLRDRFVVGGELAPSNGGTVVPTGALATHDNHAVTQPSNHAAHVVTQPSDHAAHVVTQPNNHAAHVVTQPNAHTDVPNHTHPVTDPGHFHDEFQNSATTGGLQGWGAPDASTNTPLLTGYDTGSKVTGISTNNPAGGVASQPHAGAAVDAHSAHAGAAVDAHSVHVGAAVDAHSAHAGAAVDAHSAHGIYRYAQLCFIMKL